MEKRIDLHYTYGYKQDIDLNYRRSGFFVFVEPHVPGQAPPLGSMEVLKRDLSESQAKEMVARLQAEEMQRREQVESQYPDIKQRADAAKRQTAVAKLEQLTAKREQLQRELTKTEEAISETEQFIESVDNSLKPKE
jgi:hypothetical protein